MLTAIFLLNTIGEFAARLQEADATVELLSRRCAAQAREIERLKGRCARLAGQVGQAQELVNCVMLLDATNMNSIEMH